MYAEIDAKIDYYIEFKMKLLRKNMLKIYQIHSFWQSEQNL